MNKLKNVYKLVGNQEINNSIKNKIKQFTKQNTKIHAAKKSYIDKHIIFSTLLTVFLEINITMKKTT